MAYYSKSRSQRGRSGSNSRRGRSSRSRSYKRGYSRSGNRGSQRSREVRIVIEQPSAPAVSAIDYATGQPTISGKKQRSIF